MKKYFMGTALVIIAFTLLIGCMASCGAKNEPPAPPETGGGSITVVSTYGPNDGGHTAFVELCGEFQQASGVEVIDNSADSTEEWKLGVLNSLGTGTEPDVLFFFTGPDVEGFIKENKFVPMNEIRGSFPDYALNINRSALENLKAEDGNNYAVPVKGYWERLFVNTDIFEELALPLPKEFDDLYEIAPVLIEAGYIPLAASLSEVPHYLFEAFLFNETGPSKHHSIPGDADKVPQEWIDALSQFKNMYDAGMFPGDTDNLTHADALELFQSKKAAMLVDGDWTVAHIRDTENTAVVNFPAIPGKPRVSTDLISGFSMGFYITKKAWDNPEKRDSAAAFVEFITSNPSIMRLNVSGAAMPISISEEDKKAVAGDSATPLRSSIDALNETATAFVGAVADKFRIEARSWLFSQILPLARGEVQVEDTIKEFIRINNEK